MIYFTLDGFNDELSPVVHWLEYIQLTLPKRQNRTR